VCLDSNQAGLRDEARVEPHRSAHWVKVKNPAAPAVTREAEEDWENKVLASENSPQGQHDENANGDAIGNEHSIVPAQIAPNHYSHADVPPPRSSAYV
jgi:hypothetical protein